MCALCKALMLKLGVMFLPHRMCLSWRDPSVIICLSFLSQAFICQTLFHFDSFLFPLSLSLFVLKVWRSWPLISSFVLFCLTKTNGPSLCTHTQTLEGWLRFICCAVVLLCIQQAQTCPTVGQSNSDEIKSDQLAAFLLTLSNEQLTCLGLHFYR